MKIFNSYLNVTPNKIGAKKSAPVNNIKYLPAYSKEWNNIIYSFNKNNLKNLSVNNVNINKIIKSYFSLYFKDSKFVGKTNYISLKKRRRSIKRIIVSNSNIKFTNNKAKITLYSVNQQKEKLGAKYNIIKKKLVQNVLKKFFSLYTKQLKNFNLGKVLLNLERNYLLNKFVSRKIFYAKMSMKYFMPFFKLQDLFIKKLWNRLIKIQSRICMKYFRKYNLLFSLNQYKFNKTKLLPKLTYLLEQLTEKRIQYNIVNLKSITYHSDIFTDLLTAKIKKSKFYPQQLMKRIINKVYIPKLTNKSNNYQEIDLFCAQDKHKANLLNLIFDSINYKYLRGIRLKVCGRLTKHYRADKALRVIKWKGGLKNIDSSFNKLSTVLYRGNQNTNVSYSWLKSKRRIGSFAVKGWISGK